MRKFIGEIVSKSRRSKKLTQDEFGKLYSVSGPAIFKFEKGYVRPSLDLWLRMASDSGVTEKTAVLIWLKATLPPKYQDLVELQGAARSTSKGGKGTRKLKAADYSQCEDRAQILEKAEKDANFPATLIGFIEDNELWALYQPDGKEINLLLETFAGLGAGSKELYREAIAVLRAFTSKK